VLSSLFWGNITLVATITPQVDVKCYKVLPPHRSRVIEARLSLAVMKMIVTKDLLDSSK